MKQFALTTGFAVAIPFMVLTALGYEAWSYLSDAPFPRWRV